MQPLIEGFLFFFKSAHVFDLFSALEALCDPGEQRRCLLSSPGMYQLSTPIIMRGRADYVHISA